MIPELPQGFRLYVCIACAYGLVHAVWDAWSLTTGLIKCLAANIQDGVL